MAVKLVSDMTNKYISKSSRRLSDTFVFQSNRIKVVSREARKINETIRILILKVMGTVCP